MKYIPRVSVLIPCYNAEHWVAQAIESALNQTYLNKEVIVVDDGSTDRSLEIIKSFEGRIKWEARSHSGANTVRNRLLKLSSGEWLQYLDADDYLLPQKIEYQVNCIRFVDGVDLVYSPIFYEENNSRKLLAMPSETDFILNFLNWGCIQTGGLLLRSNVIREVGGWREDQPCCQEHKLLSCLIKTDKKFLYCGEGKAVHRYWNHESIGHRDVVQIINEIIKILDNLRAYLISKNLWLYSYDKLFFYKKFECARSVYRKNPCLATQIINRIIKENDRFFPYGPAAPLLYKMSYGIFGFATTEKLARIKRCIFLPRFDIH